MCAFEEAEHQDARVANLDCVFEVWNNGREHQSEVWSFCGGLTIIQLVKCFYRSFYVAFSLQILSFSDKHLNRRVIKCDDTL